MTHQEQPDGMNRVGDDLDQEAEPVVDEVVHENSPLSSLSCSRCPQKQQQQQQHPHEPWLEAAAFLSTSNTPNSGGYLAATSQTSQSEILTQNPDLTQFGDLEDEDDLDGSFLSPLPESSQEGEMRQEDSLYSPSHPLRRKNVPWGRLIPCWGGGSGGATATPNGGHAPALHAAPIDLLPRRGPLPPKDSVALSDATKTVDKEGEDTATADGDARTISPLRPGDVFNEYLLGRSAACDVVQPKPSSSSSSSSSSSRRKAVRATAGANGGLPERDLPEDLSSEGGRSSAATTATSSTCSSQNPTSGSNCKMVGGFPPRMHASELSEYAFTLVSNKHARIYCLQTAPCRVGSNNSSNIGSGGVRSYEIYVEVMSNNGTVVNGTLLRRCERRLLNSGDEICLVSPQTLGKRARSQAALQQVLQQYSYVFVANQQQGLFSTLATFGASRVGGANLGGARASTQATAAASSSNARKRSRPPIHPPGSLPPQFSSRKPAVDPRAVKSHSFVPALDVASSRHEDTSVSVVAHRVAHLVQLGEGTGGDGGFDGRHPLEPPGVSDSQDSFTSLPPSASLRPTRLQQHQRRISPRRQPTRRFEEDYDIRDLLGTGTVGEVRRAIERRTGIQRAVKVIPIKQTLGGGVAGRRNIRNNDSDTTAAVLTAEASLLQHLDHPYVVKLINVYTSPSAVYLVMELLQGGDLFDRIVLKGRYNEVEARRIMRRLLAAIYYLHEERHVVHRDLKPENILLQSRDSDVDIQLTDFGLAKSVTGSDCLKTFCGTPLYFAPEILQRRNTVMGRGRYNKQADMWSLGVILYILLSGSQPFDGDQWMNSPSTTPVDFPEEFWSGVSEPARDLVRRMLVEDPRRRITAQAACTHPWILEDDGDTHCHPLDDPKLPRNCRRSVPLPAPNPDDRASHSSAVKEETDSSITSVPRDILLLRNAGNCGNTGHGECAESHPSAIGQGNLRIATVDREDDATKAIDAAARIADKGVSWMPSVEDAGQAILKPTVDSLFTSENASARCHAAATQGVENSELSDDGILSQFSDRTESITSFESSDAAIADSDVFVKLDKGTRTSKAQPLSVKKENDGSPLKRPRKRRVTDSVRSHKSRAALATSKATEGDHKPRSTDAPMKQARKQTTLSTWIKQKK